MRLFYIWFLIYVDVRSGQEIRRHCAVRHTHPSPLRHPWFVVLSLLWLAISFSDALTLSEHLIPMDSRVEIDAKIAAGYFTSGKAVTSEDLVKTVGRSWEETEH